ncbi:SKA complex subunit 1-like [Diadema antillarum]|uniref:SKA complex subunit 1-like n=1 Tax=Diadema antillarum TaxID=105358 RepID=UPI003A870983
MDSTSLEDLQAYFEVKLTSLTTCMDLVSIASEPYGVQSECREQLLRMEQDLCEAESAVAQLKEWVKMKREQLAAAQVLHENLKSLNSRLHYIEAHLPERLPVQQSHHQTQPIVEDSPPLQSKPVTRNAEESTREGPKSNKPSKPPPSPLMDYVTVPEFEAVPKYMKGRMTYNSINEIVDGFNRALESKYHLMKRPRSGLNDRDRKQYYKYKEQQNKHTAGAYFVTEDDLKRLGKLKVDSSARAALTMLRHCGRMREIRGGGLTRYAVIPL